jgi:hypothetical protein
VEPPVNGRSRKKDFEAIAGLRANGTLAIVGRSGA